MTSPRPLEGLTVVEIGHSVAAPYAGMILGELGADVVKVENPKGGDYARGWGPPFWHGASSAFQGLNRGKRGVAVDLSDPAEVGKLRDFITGRADVVLQNLRPGVAAKVGLGAKDLTAAKPELICVELGAFGPGGPLSDRPGYDPLMQAYGGLMSVTGEEGRPPVRVGVSIIDMGAGLWSVIGILAALVERGRTARGGEIGTSLFETALAWMTVPAAGYLASGDVRGRQGSGTAEIVPYQVFACADGELMIAAGNDNLFRRLCQSMGHAEWADDARFALNADRVRNRDAIVSLITAAVAGRPIADVSAALDAAGVPFAPIQSIDQVVEDPQTQALGMVQASPDGELALMGIPLRFDDARPPFRRRAPGLGEHDREVFAEGGRPA